MLHFARFLIIVAPPTYGFSTLQIENITTYYISVLYRIYCCNDINKDIRDRDVEN